MKVYELITELSKMPAGLDVRVDSYNLPVLEINYIRLDEDEQVLISLDRLDEGQLKELREQEESNGTGTSPACERLKGE